ncbi:MAG: TetR family transcriptional regulator, partial [Gammaproteobacteria bacterium]|nr:TetR family transcriptional regulator [Gammaproteobacteria bacterium]
MTENAAGAVIGTLKVTDPDAGDKQSFTVSDARFEVVNSKLQLKPGVSLDYEQGSSVNVDVTATDKGGNQITTTFTINVGNVNEAQTALMLDNMSVSEKRRRRRTEILHAALEVMTEVGYGNASMEQIADRALLTRVGLYKHFKDKAALVTALRAHKLLELAGRVETAILNASGFEAQITAIIHETVLYQRENQGFFRVLFASSFSHELAADTSLKPFLYAVAKVFSSLEAQHLRGVEPIEHAALLAGMAFAPKCGTRLRSSWRGSLAARGAGEFHHAGVCCAACCARVNGMDDFTPSRLVTHDHGGFSLCFDHFDATYETLEARDLQGGGYTWHAIVESLVRLHAPEISSRVDYDPEGSMFVAYGTDREALLRVAQLIRRAIEELPAEQYDSLHLLREVDRRLSNLLVS